VNSPSEVARPSGWVRSNSPRREWGTSRGSGSGGRRELPRILSALLVAAGTLLSACAGPPAPTPAPEPPPPETPPVEEPTPEALEVPPSDSLLIYMLDVGQGDALLLITPAGRAVLYDGGPSDRRALEHLEALGVDSLELVIASHPHRDHIGGLGRVIRTHPPRHLLDSGVSHTTLTYERYLEAIAETGVPLTVAESQTLSVDGVELEVLPPSANPSWTLNDRSVGVVARWGEVTVTLGGDAERAQWEWWLEEGVVPEGPVQIHKASHHASRNGDTGPALRRLRPRIVLAGVGAGNTFGHPHAEALELYAEVNARVYRTDLHGTITVVAWEDGRTLVRPDRGGADWESGPGVAPDPEEDQDPEVEEPRDDSADRDPSPADPEPACVELNRASAMELARIVHIGEERALLIIELRQERAFTSVDDLARVPGIGPARIRDIVAEGLACVE
jgi:competence protein ComEC